MSLLWWIKHSTEFNAVYPYVPYLSIPTYSFSLVLNYCSTHSAGPKCSQSLNILSILQSCGVDSMYCGIERYQHFGGTCCRHLYNSLYHHIHCYDIKHHCWYKQFMFLTSSTVLMFQNIKAQHHPARIATIQNINEGKKNNYFFSSHLTNPSHQNRKLKMCFSPSWNFNVFHPLLPLLHFRQHTFISKVHPPTTFAKMQIYTRHNIHTN
jgi:hypothetical protein